MFTPSPKRFPRTITSREPDSWSSLLLNRLIPQRNVDALPARLTDIKMALEYGLHVLEHRIEVVAIDRRIVVTVALGEAMRKIASATGIHEPALPTLHGKID